MKTITVIQTDSDTHFLRGELTFDEDLKRYVLTPTVEVWHGYEGATGVQYVNMPDEYFDSVNEAKNAGWE